MDNETISGKCRNIRQQFTDLLNVLKEGSAQVSTTVTTPSIQDLLERFMLRAGNLGVLRKPTSKLSLDSRLASSQDLRDYICTELEDMSEALEDLMNIVNGSMPNREIGYGSGSENDLDREPDDGSYSDDPVDEAGSILQVISQGITSLLKIGILVRRPASSGTDRFHRASRDSTSAFLDRFDIDYVQHKHPKLGSGEQSLRIGKAIAKRRQFIRYCRDHKHNLAAEEDEGMTGSQKATTAKQSSKATTFIATENLRDLLQGSVEEDDAVSHCSVSTTSESLATLKLPRLADLSPDDEPFECPICYTLQQFRSEQAWRRHAYRDLKAYVCTVGGTECDDKFFEDRTSWFNHELEQHRCSYVCVLCGVNDEQNKTTRSLLRRHILKAHGKFESDQLERLEDAGRDTIKIFKSNDCPFCDEWSELIAKKKSPGGIAQSGGNFVVSTSRLKKHVAMHLEQLAIFALPRHELDTPMDEDESQGSDPREKDSRSSASFALSFGSENERVIEEHQSDQAPSAGEGSIAHAGSGTEKSPTTAPEKELNPEIEELKQQLEEFQPEKKPKEEERQKKHAEVLAEAQEKAKVEFEAELKAAAEERRKHVKEDAEFKPELKAGEEIRKRAEEESAKILPVRRSSNPNRPPPAPALRRIQHDDYEDYRYEYQAPAPAVRRARGRSPRPSVSAGIYEDPSRIPTPPFAFSPTPYEYQAPAPAVRRARSRSRPRQRRPSVSEGTYEDPDSRIPTPPFRFPSTAYEYYAPAPAVRRARSRSRPRQRRPSVSVGIYEDPDSRREVANPHHRRLRNTVPDLLQTQGLPQDDVGSPNTSREAFEPLKESASPVADSEEEEPGSIEEKHKKYPW